MLKKILNISKYFIFNCFSFPGLKRFLKSLIMFLRQTLDFPSLYVMKKKIKKKYESLLYITKNHLKLLFLR